MDLVLSTVVGGGEHWVLGLGAVIWSGQPRVWGGTQLLWAVYIGFWVVGRGAGGW